MKIATIVLCLFIILLYSCSTRSSKWAEIKKSNDVYPGDSIVFYDFKVLDFAERRWVNISYKNYEYKDYCKRKAEFQFDASEPKVRQWLSEDSLVIAKLLHSYLKEEGVSHFVAQSLSNNRLNIYFYLEDSVSAYKTYERIRLPTTLTLTEDKDWKTYELFEGRK